MAGRIKRAITAPLRARKRQRVNRAIKEIGGYGGASIDDIKRAEKTARQEYMSGLSASADEVAKAQKEARAAIEQLRRDEAAQEGTAQPDEPKEEPKEEAGPSRAKGEGEKAANAAKAKPGSKRFAYEMHRERLAGAARAAQQAQRGQGTPPPIVPGAQPTAGTRAQDRRQQTRQRLAEEAKARKQQQETIQQATAAGVQAGLQQARARVPQVKRQAPPLLRPASPAARPSPPSAGIGAGGRSGSGGGRAQGLSRGETIFRRIQAMRRYGPHGSYWMPGARRAAGWDIRSENLTEAQEGEIRANIASILSVPGGQLPEGNKRALADRAAEGADVNARPGAQGEWVLWIDGQQFAARQYAQEQPA